MAQQVMAYDLGSVLGSMRGDTDLHSMWSGSMPTPTLICTQTQGWEHTFVIPSADGERQTPQSSPDSYRSNGDFRYSVSTLHG